MAHSVMFSSQLSWVISTNTMGKQIYKLLTYIRQTHQGICCSHTEGMAVDEDSDQNMDL